MGVCVCVCVCFIYLFVCVFNYLYVYGGGGGGGRVLVCANKVRITFVSTSEPISLRVGPSSWLMNFLHF